MLSSNKYTKLKFTVRPTQTESCSTKIAAERHLRLSVYQDARTIYSLNKLPASLNAQGTNI